MYHPPEITAIAIGLAEELPNHDGRYTYTLIRPYCEIIVSHHGTPIATIDLDNNIEIWTHNLNHPLNKTATIPYANPHTIEEILTAIYNIHAKLNHNNIAPGGLQLND